MIKWLSNTTRCISNNYKTLTKVLMKKTSFLITMTASYLMMHQAQAIEPVYEGENGIRAKVFETNCLACHSSELSGESRNRALIGEDYDTYANAKMNGSSAINSAVEKTGMPPASSSLPELTDEQKQALKNWQILVFPEKKLPTIYSSDSSTLSLPHVYLKDANGDIVLKWDASMKLVPNSSPLQFELIDAKEIDPAH
jgi:cytochrome c5